MNLNNELIILKKYKLFLFSIERILVNVPKKDYICRSSFYNKAIEVLELIHTANVVEEKKEYQKQIIAKLAVLDFYIERLKHNKYISESYAKELSLKLNELVSMIYGWIKSTK